MENIETFEEKRKYIPGYEGIYEVSNLGRVKSVVSNKIRKSRTTRYGYKDITLSKEGKRRYFFVHYLVMLAFIRDRKEKEQINHIDSVRSNNVIYALGL